MTTHPPVVAVFNTSPETVQMLRHLFEGAGVVVTRSPANFATAIELGLSAPCRLLG